MLCDDLDRWGGIEAPEGGDTCVHIAESHCLQQKLTQYW